MFRSCCCVLCAGGESDCRFLYCACAIAFILGGVAEHIDLPKVQSYIRSCLSYDGGIGLVPGQESHGGSTYTALAGLGLCAEGLDEVLNVEERLGTTDHAIAKWCLARQMEEWGDETVGTVGNGGFQGRLNKVADTCYTFWVLGALQILDQGERGGGGGGGGGGEKSAATPTWLDMFDRDAIRFFLLDEDNGTHDHLRGGFGKTPGALPDILHSYYGVCGLALIGHEKDAILPLDASLSISKKSRERLTGIQKKRGW